MSGFYIRKDGKVIKPADLICCKYRGIGVYCSQEEFNGGKCKHCGWNPGVEAGRKVAERKAPAVRKAVKWGGVCGEVQSA